MSKWTNKDAGPRQSKATCRALQNVAGMGYVCVERTGTIGVSEHETVYTVIGSGKRYAKPDAMLHAIGERFAWEITKDNAAAILQACEDAMKEINADRANWPTEDRRVTPEKAEERARASSEREAQRHAEQTAAKAAAALIMGKRPAWAKAAIVAELHESECDSMTDYFGSKVVRRVVIGWRSGSREDFRQLRRAAATLPETAHLGPGSGPCTLQSCMNDRAQGGLTPQHWPTSDATLAGLGSDYGSSRRSVASTDEARAALTSAGYTRCEDVYGCECWGNGLGLFITLSPVEIEHRDNYSMGHGNWVGTDRYSGWQVRSVSIDGDYGVEGGHYTYEDHLPEPQGLPTKDDPAERTGSSDGAYTITDRTHTKKGTTYSQVEMSARVDRERFDALRDSCRAAGGWYSRQWSNIPGGFAFATREAAESWAAATLAT